MVEEVVVSLRNCVVVEEMSGVVVCVGPYKLTTIAEWEGVGLKDGVVVVLA